ncbi:hypothetical protein [Halobacillus karajensis]|uniref:hypothetical protein n=1 Tax=Halobacillus karajensis TaxID=195088 RepID=UPI00045CA846|nr:hypothetical protein [Halobacillus karajensis]CDQ21687.1 hypothetical protein BN982_04096 [Halobacillus karajensis]
MEKTLTLELHNAEIEVIGMEDEVHMLDLDNSGRKSLTNALSNIFCMKVLDLIGANPEDYTAIKFIAYGSDGMVCLYDPVQNSFAKHDGNVFLPFADVMKERKAFFD